jgi:hypothetical protein
MLVTTMSEINRLNGDPGGRELAQAALRRLGFGHGV